MRLIEDVSVQNQLIGLECLRLLLIHRHSNDDNLNCISILKSNGYDQLVFIKLRNMLHKTEIETFQILIENLCSILVSSLSSRTFSKTSENLKSTLETDSKSEEVFLQLMENLVLNSSNSLLITLHLNAIREHFFPLMKCTLLKFTTTFLSTLNALLDSCTMAGDSDLIELCLIIMYDFLFIIKEQISFHEMYHLLTDLCKLLIKFDTSENLHKEVHRIFVLIENSQQDSPKRALQQFCTQCVQSKMVWHQLSRSPSDLVELLKRNSTRASPH